MYLCTLFFTTYSSSSRIISIAFAVCSNQLWFLVDLRNLMKTRQTSYENKYYYTYLCSSVSNLLANLTLVLSGFSKDTSIGKFNNSCSTITAMLVQCCIIRSSSHLYLKFYKYSYKPVSHQVLLTWQWNLQHVHELSYHFYEHIPKRML